MSHKNRKAKAVVMVALPSYDGTFVHQFVSSYTQTFVDCLKNDIVLAPEFGINFSLVQYARNWLVSKFLESKVFTHLMWIDSDLGFDPTAVRRLINTGKDVIGGSYTTKSPTKPIYPFIAKGPVENGIQEVTTMPGGFVLMSRKAVQALADASPKFVMEHGGKDYEVAHVCDLEFITTLENGFHVRRLMGEDYVMQLRLAALGFKLYLMTDITFAHVGAREFRGNVAKAYEEEKAQNLRTMWHPDAWYVGPPKHTDPPAENVLVVPVGEVPNPNTLELTS